MADRVSRTAASPLIACIGDIDVDWLMQVDWLPSQDDKIPARSLVRAPGGMAANVAVAIQHLGGRSRLIGRVGGDDEGQGLVAYLSRRGVDVDHVTIIPGERTFQCLIFVAPGGERALVRMPSALIVPTVADIGSGSLAGCRHVHITFAEPAVAMHVIELARRLGISLSIDLEKADLPPDPGILGQLIAGCDVMFLNRRAREELDRRGALLDYAGAVVTTLGANGARFERRGVSMTSPGCKVDTRDTTGAGDAFAGAFLLRWLAEPDRPQSALDEANLYAARSTCTIGAQAMLDDDALTFPPIGVVAGRRL